jgi:hypothetical protein
MACSTTSADGNVARDVISSPAKDQKSQDAVLEQSWVDLITGSPTGQGQDLPTAISNSAVPSSARQRDPDPIRRLTGCVPGVAAAARAGPAGRSPRARPAPAVIRRWCAAWKAETRGMSAVVASKGPTMKRFTWSARSAGFEPANPLFSRQRPASAVVPRKTPAQRHIVSERDPNNYLLPHSETRIDPSRAAVPMSNRSRPGACR